jgi:hypothetical protein
VGHKDVERARIEPNGFLVIGDRRFRFALRQQRVAHLANRHGIVLIEGDRRFQLHLRLRQASLVPTQNPYDGACLRPVRVALQSLADQLLCQRRVQLERTAHPLGDSRCQVQCHLDLGIDATRIEGERPSIQIELLLANLGSHRINLKAQGPPAHDEIARIGVRRTLQLDAAPCIPDEFGIEGAGKAAGNLALRLGQIAAVGVEAVGPDMRPAFAVDQLDVDLRPFAQAPHAALEDIADAEFARDMPDIDRFSFVNKRRGPGDHEAVGDARQVGRQIVGYRVREVCLLRIGRKVGERQDDERNPRRRIGGRDVGGGRARRGPVDREGAHRPTDVFEPLLAEIAKGEVELTGGILLHPGRDADAAGFGERLEAGGDVDAVAEDVAVLDDDVPDVDADAEFDVLAGSEPGVAFGHPPLDFGRAAQRVDDAAELDQEAVADGLDDPAVMRGDSRVDQFGADRLQAFERALLVGADQARVAGHIRGEDGGKTAGSGHGPDNDIAAPSLSQIGDTPKLARSTQPRLSSSSIRRATMARPFDQKAGSAASRPNGARSSRWRKVPPARNRPR